MKEFKVSDCMDQQEKIKECYSTIMQVLETYQCRLYVEALLKEKGTDFMIAVVPLEVKKDENI